jgi:hypothetical protein
MGKKYERLIILLDRLTVPAVRVSVLVYFLYIFYLVIKLSLYILSTL